MDPQLDIKGKLWSVIVIVMIGCCPAFAQTADGLKVFISVDMEGVAGIANGSQLHPEGFDYPLSRKLMTEEANAAIEGALAAGAKDITVSDGHGNGLSILPDELNPKAQLIRSWPRPLGMSEGIDQTYNAVICIGYHASTLSADAVLAHTFSDRYVDVKFNGRRVSEAVAVAAVAGHFGVPVILVSGDNIIVDQVHRDIDPNIVGVVVKRAIGLHSADSVSPQTSRDLIRDKTREALSSLHSFHSFRLSNPVALEVTFRNIQNAEILSFLSGVRRVDAATIRFTGKDILEVERFLQVLSDYNSSQ